MRVDELDYELPDALIARYPALRREDARLLIVSDAGLEHEHVSALEHRLPPGAVLVVNDSRVIAARLCGVKEATGGRVELLLVRLQAETPITREGVELRAEHWSAMAQASKRPRPGLEIAIGPELVARFEQRLADHGLWRVALYSRLGGPVLPLREAEGKVPLPPYMGRPEEPLDRERYQTVYARVPGAVAAPTAGLHLSEELLRRIEARGIEVAPVTLHVGPGTFRPVSVTDLDDHPMHAEQFVVPAATASAIAAARERGSPVVAVGTTVVRTLESAADDSRPGEVRATEGETRLLIQPGYRFRVVDGLLTNFHLPGSTLLALVYAFGGTEPVRQAYRVAMAAGYRFYSYGDAMYFPARARS